MVGVAADLPPIPVRRDDWQSGWVYLTPSTPPPNPRSAPASACAFAGAGWTAGLNQRIGCP
jgi:hypothetical protein